MPPLKTIITFVLVYTILIIGGLFINQLLSIQPAVSINVAAMVIAAIVVRKSIKAESRLAADLLCLSFIGGICAVTAISLLPYYYNSFEIPSMSEFIASFIFNAVAVYLTLYLASIKKEKSN